MSLPVAEKKYLGRYDVDELAYLKKENGNAAISLFTGCGGAAIGISQAGFEVRVMVEWDKAACDTLRFNWTKAGHEEWCDKSISEEKKGKMKRTEEERNEIIAELEKQKADGPRKTGDEKGWYREREPVILQGDITKLSTEEILKAGGLRVGEAALLEGGFPCQGFSTARGRRVVEDPRNKLYEECVRVIRGSLPKTFMLENVRGLISMEKGKILRMICNDLANSGYTIYWKLLDAADYGVPQHRNRIFIIGERNDVLVQLEGMERPQYHIGGERGPINHPKWFEERYPIKTQLSLFDQLKI
jgi:site-specific DNA-cytosine methylase